jgi:hypothetical protein
LTIRNGATMGFGERIVGDRNGREYMMSSAVERQRRRRRCVDYDLVREEAMQGGDMHAG